jgi:hypothetical protein
MIQRFILRLLRLFEAFRQLEQERAVLQATSDQKNQEAIWHATEAAGLRDELISWKDRVSVLEARLEDSHQKELEAREVLTDFIAQQKWGKTIFGRAPELPSQPSEAASPIYGRRHGRSLVREKNKQFLLSFQEADNK